MTLPENCCEESRDYVCGPGLGPSRKQALNPWRPPWFLGALQTPAARVWSCDGEPPVPQLVHSDSVTELVLCLQSWALLLALESGVFVTLTIECTLALMGSRRSWASGCGGDRARAPSAHLSSAPSRSVLSQSMVQPLLWNTPRAQTVQIMTLLKRLSCEYHVCFLRFALS